MFNEKFSKFKKITLIQSNIYTSEVFSNYQPFRVSEINTARISRQIGYQEKRKKQIIIESVNALN